MSPSNVACVVLASGLSSRFGAEDKLQADLGGVTVLDAVLSTVRSVGFGQIFLVSQTKYQAVCHDGVTWIKNTNPEAGQGHTLRLGLRAARDNGWNDVVVALGDMPLVSFVNFVNLLEESDAKQSVVSICESLRLPPAYFDEDAMDLILADTSNNGARSLFNILEPLTVLIDAEAALDVDTPSDLDRVRKILKNRKSTRPKFC